MALNLMIIGAFIALMGIGSVLVDFLEKSEERKKKRVIRDIWYRV